MRTKERKDVKKKQIEKVRNIRSRVYIFKESLPMIFGILHVILDSHEEIIYKYTTRAGGAVSRSGKEEGGRADYVIIGYRWLINAFFCKTSKGTKRAWIRSLLRFELGI